MLRECLEYLAIRPDGVYLDATAGMGGHAGAIARELYIDGPGPGVRPRCGESGARASEYRGLRLADSLSQRFFFFGGEGAGGRRDHASGRAAGGPGCIEISVDGGRKGLLPDGRWAAGHAHGSQPGADGGRHRQLRSGKAARRLDISVRRGKEEPENSQSNRAGTADKNDRSVGQADRECRAPYGQTCIPPRRHSWRCASR